jgi:recombination protein RecA
MLLHAPMDTMPANLFLADAPEVQVKSVRTGIPALDDAICGLRTGITELWGEAAAGKTTIMLHIIAGQQATGRQVTLVDTEHTFDPIYAQSLGVDLRQLRLMQPHSTLEAAEAVTALLKSGRLDLLALDSIAAMPADQIGVRREEEVEKYLARWCHLSHRRGIPILMTNHVIDAEQDGRICFGDNREPAGGLSLRHYVNLSIRVLRQRGQSEESRFSLRFSKARQAVLRGGLDLRLAHGAGAGAER